MRPLPITAIVCLLAAPALHADVKLPSVIGNHMVLQRGMRVPIWGTADPGEEVTVTFLQQHLVTKAGSDGRWRVELAPLATGGPFEMAIDGKNQIRLRDILVGEVWVCSGQSNMEWRTGQAKDADKEAAAANHAKLRFFKVPRNAASEPVRDCTAQWTSCTPDTVPDFSAVGYFFGRELYGVLRDQANQVPIGLIQTAWGGTAVEAWTSPEALQRCPEAKPVLDGWAEQMARLPEEERRHEERMKKWREQAAAARQRGERPPRQPQAPRGRKHQNHPSNLFHGMIVPLLPFAIRGAIWYQGEANASRAWQYRGLFPAMIRDWREQWDQGDFPFLFVQLANYKTSLAPEAWAELREAQTMTLALPNTGMAVTIDIGESKDIHPKNKQEVGRRLALCARSLVYGEDVVSSGPVYASMAAEGDTIEISFDHAAGGLVARGDRLAGFEIAGADRKFVPADATLDGSKVVVRSPEVGAPVAVRYAWRDDPVANLYNQAGLPAVPFRTDDWPGVTVKNIRP